MKKKLIGLLGGMGPESGVILQSRINRKAQHILGTKKDEDYPDIIHFSLPSRIPDRTDFLLGLTEENPAMAAIDIARHMNTVAANMDRKVILCVACNTFYVPPIWNIFYQEVSKLSHVEIFHLVDETVNDIQQNIASSSRIAVLSTIGATKERLYESRLAPLGYDIVRLNPGQEQDFHKAIYDHDFGLKAHSTSTEKACNIVLDIVKLLEEQKIDKILLGCSELGIVFPDVETSRFIQPLQIAAEKLVHLSMEK